MHAGACLPASGAVGASGRPPPQTPRPPASPARPNAPLTRAARHAPDDERGQAAAVGAQPVAFAAGRRVVHRAAHGVAQVDVALEVVGPGGRVGVLEVGHERRGAAVERIYDHLALHGARDLNAPVDEAGRGRRAAPARLLAHGARLGQEVRQPAGLDGGEGGERMGAGREDGAGRVGSQPRPLDAPSH